MIELIIAVLSGGVLAAVVSFAIDTFLRRHLLMRRRPPHSYQRTFDSAFWQPEEQS